MCIRDRKYHVFAAPAPNGEKGCQLWVNTEEPYMVGPRSTFCFKLADFVVAKVEPDLLSVR
eukprot:12317326-Prorocentrum_lima.AAC.1